MMPTGCHIGRRRLVHGSGMWRRRGAVGNPVADARATRSTRVVRDIA